MNFSIATYLLFLFTTTVAASASHEIGNARRFLEDQSAVEDDYSFLTYYSLKMISCSGGAIGSSQSPTEYGILLFRLCPSSGECSDDSGNVGCDAGYGDYVVGINTFVKAYLEHKGDEMQLSDDNFQIEDLAECRQYYADKDSDYADNVYYVGPTCTTDGTGIRMALFSDNVCKRLEETVTFEDISAGIALPYSDGGLVSPSCESCSSSTNEDSNGDTAVNEMCMGLYQLAIYSCEALMAMTASPNSRGDTCDSTNSFLPKSTKSQVGKVLGWSFFVIAALGLAAFTVTAMKNKKKNMSAMEVDKNSFHRSID